MLKGTSVNYNSDGSIAGMVPVQWNLRLGQQGNDVYVQGIFEDLPMAWIKGTIDDDVLTFASGQYLGMSPFHQKFYFASTFMNELGDAQFVCEDGVYKGGGTYLLLNSEKNAVAPYAVYVGVTISRVPDVAATPAKPAVVQYEPYNSEYGYGYVCFDLPTQDVDGNAISRDKMSYRMYYEQQGQQHDYVFGTSWYRNLEQDQTEMDYMFFDGFDFYLGGSFVSLSDECLQWSKIGVQTVYRGGNEERSSDICWYDLASSGIESVSADVVDTVYTDLQGRRVTPATRGLVVKTERLADGTQRSKKVCIAH